MTCEQFVFWLAGYLSGGRDNDHDVLITDIVHAIKKVNNPHLRDDIYLTIEE